jgi:hypothetical protein
VSSLAPHKTLTWCQKWDANKVKCQRFLKTGFTSDLGSLNIQRGRDHGIPSYNEIRKFLGLSPVPSMADRPEEISPENWDALAQVYKNPDEVDVYPAGLSETPIPGKGLKY